MQPRLVVLGVNVVVVAFIVGLVGWFAREYYLIGIAASIALFAIVSITIGLGHSEPSLEFLSRYSDVLRSVVLTLLEHLNINPVNLYAVPKDKIVYLIASSMERPPKNPGSFIRVEDNQVYLGIEVPPPKEQPAEMVSLDNIGDYIREIVSSRYGIAGNVNVSVKDKTITILIENIEPQLLEFVKKPLSPISVFLLTSTARALGRPVALRNEALGDRSLTITFEVL